MGGKSSPPPAPDYTGAAQAQAASSAEVTQAQTNANRPDMVTPFGTSNWVNGGDNHWTNTINLTPASQEALTQQQTINAQRSTAAEGLASQATSALANPGNAFNTFLHFIVLAVLGRSILMFRNPARTISKLRALFSSSCSLLSSSISLLWRLSLPTRA